MASKDKTCSIVVRLALPPYCSVDSVPIKLMKSNSLTFTNLSITFMEHLLVQLDDNLKGSLDLFQVLILDSLWTVTIFQRGSSLLCFVVQGQHSFVPRSYELFDKQKAMYSKSPQFYLLM